MIQNIQQQEVGLEYGMSVLKFRILYDPQHRKGEGGSGEGVFGLSCGASLGACALCPCALQL